MLRLIKSEFLRGYLFLKFLLLFLWIGFARFFILLFVNPGRLSSLEEAKVGDYIFAIVVFIVLSIWGNRYVFGGFRCVPYWGRKFSRLELARLLKDEVFETVEIPDCPRIKNIKASENWVIIDNLYFYKPLSGWFCLTRMRSGIHYSTWGNYTAIDGGKVDSLVMAFWKGTQLGVAEQISIVVCSLFGVDCDNPYCNTIDASKIAFEKVWGDKPYKELLNTDMRLLKQQWMQVRYNS